MSAFYALRRHTSFTCLSSRLRTGLPVAANTAFITAGVTTPMVGSPTSKPGGDERYFATVSP